MRIVITGASGILGGYLLRRLGQTGHDVVAWRGATDVPLTDPDASAAAFRAARPDAVIHAAALSRIADCHRDPVAARRVNTEATDHLARLADEHRARFVYVSTDLVFDGEKGHYAEADVPVPLSVYGRTKREAEAAVLASPQGVVARVSLLFGPGICGRKTFFDGMVEGLRAGTPVTLFADEWRTPLSLAVAARALVEIAESDVTGLLHVGGPERLSRAEMGQRLQEFLGVEKAAIVLMSRGAVPAAEPRPRDTSLDSSRWRGLFPGCPWPDYFAALRELLAAR